MKFENTIEFARACDSADTLARFRTRFYIPRKNHQEVLYFCGNSLGLQPRETFAHIEQELFDWAAFGVEGHVHAKHPWVSAHERFASSLAKISGALPSEVVAMNSLTVNLHLLLVSFYRPDKKRNKIIFEKSPFPSDRYALDSQVRFHGFDPQTCLIELEPREGEHVLRTEDILSAIEKNRDSLALVMMGGVNFLSGQAFDMKRITDAAHKAGAYAGFDLAHAMGNIKLELHYWEVDFACWCSYKYLNSGPGSVGGIFVHEKHHTEKNIPRFEGWWGNRADKKFLMEKTFHAAPSAEAWQMSNAPVLSMAAHHAALELFDEAGMDALIEKSKNLTAFMESAILEINSKHKSKTKRLDIITPSDPLQRGCQLSIIAHGRDKELFNALQTHGVIADWREPNVIRFAPVPLYNSFEDVFRFGEILDSILSSEKK